LPGEKDKPGKLFGGILSDLASGKQEEENPGVGSELWLIIISVYPARLSDFSNQYP